MTPINGTEEVVLPSLGESVTEATITRWLKAVGDPVELEEPLVEVATDKVDTEITSPVTGILADILEPEDALVDVGTTIAIVNRIGGDAPALSEGPDGPPAGCAAPKEPPRAPDSVESSLPEQKPPSTRPSDSRDSGLLDRVETLPRIRRIIAERMVASLQTAAQVTTVIEVDLTAIASLRAGARADYLSRTGYKLSFLPFVVAAAVEALSAHPVINSSLNADGTEVTYHGLVHLGMAVDSPKGLMVPVIRDAQALSITGLVSAIAEHAEAVRSGKIKPESLSGGTFTVTNTGSRGALFDTPIINQPQSAILGVGAVVERLMAHRDAAGNLLIQPRSMAYLSLSYDHRIVDGADAARYLTTVRQRLERGFSEADLQRG
ncbi:2-oxo acid dehydrogenase subunit E2 [Mycolicibacterium baixiangningiae]|uniref:2-oxo acid dehydrogenase subunit E2 n=1 Tax=Mycolicibacterium baixiangningiae TaxID=2761578 RepID=UPI001867B88A|nr:2-oxo acid dehydrogenase subunit E2 [Mycolicibacterium baixiangningiae]